MRVPDRRTDRLTGIPTPDRTPDPRAPAEILFGDLLRAEGLPDRGAYRPGEVCRLLRISPTTLRLFCDLAAYPGAERDDSRALESFKVGCHHRITRRALVEWLARNRNARRAGV